MVITRQSKRPAKSQPEESCNQPVPLRALIRQAPAVEEAQQPPYSEAESLVMDKIDFAWAVAGMSATFVCLCVTTLIFTCDAQTVDGAFGGGSDGKNRAMVWLLSSGLVMIAWLCRMIGAQEKK